jgi:hypothetical protein
LSRGGSQSDFYGLTSLVDTVIGLRTAALLESPLRKHTEIFCIRRKRNRNGGSYGEGDFGGVSYVYVSLQ